MRKNKERRLLVLNKMYNLMVIWYIFLNIYLGKNHGKKMNKNTNSVRLFLMREQILYTAYNDNTPLAEILRSCFDVEDEDEESFYKEAIQKLRHNLSYKITRLERTENPELKKKYGDKVINALDNFAGNILSTFLYLLMI